MTTATPLLQPAQKNASLINGGRPGRIPMDTGGSVDASLLTHGGTVVLNGATPVTVADAYVTANSIIMTTLKTVGGTVSPTQPNILTITPGTGFTIGGVALDTSTYNYVVIG